MELNYITVLYIISIFTSLSEITAIICFAKLRLKTLHTLPSALRYFLYSCCIPYVIFNAFAGFYIALMFLIYGSYPGIGNEIVRNIITFGAQQCRNFFFIIALERIFATKFLEKYNLPQKIDLFWYLTVFTYSISLLHLGFTLFCKYVPNMSYLYELQSYYSFATHVITLIVCSVLYKLNQKMYKQSAYRITLKKRYKIFENIKILNFIFPSMLIYTLLTPLAPIIGIICNTYNLWTNPNCLWHISYNLPFLLICIRHLMMPPPAIENNILSSNATAVTVIKNALGKDLPASISSNKYFNDLQQQWK